MEFERAEDDFYIAMVSAAMGGIALMERDVPTAVRLGLRSLQANQAMGDVASITLTLRAAAALWAIAGRLEEAATVLGAFEGHCRRYGVRPPMNPDAFLALGGPLDELLAALEQPELAAARAHGEIDEHGRRARLHVRARRRADLRTSEAVRAPAMLAVRAGEGRTVALLAGLFASIEAARGAGDVAYVTLFLSRLGPTYLPYLYIALGGVSLVVALGYGVGLGKLPRRPFLVGLLLAFAGTLVVLRLTLASGAPIAFGVIGVAINVVNTIMLTLVWTIAATALDARQAKRLFPLVTSAAIAGGFVGTLTAGPLTALIGPENLVLVVAALIVLGAAFAARIGTRATRSARAQTGRPAATSALAQLRAGFDDVRRSPLLRLVAIAYVLFSILMFSVQFPYQTAIADAFGDDDAALATFVGLVQAGVTAISFVVSIALANRIFARFGVVAAALILPVVYVLGFGTWLVQFTLATAVAVSFSQQVVQRSISNPAWSALYTVVPSERRPQVLAFMDGVPGQLGVSLSGVLLLAAGAIATASLTPVFALGLATALICTWVVVLVRRRYGAALVQTLRAGLGEQVLEGGRGLAAMGRDQAVAAELSAALGDPTPAVRGMAADLLGRLGDPATADAIEPLLADEDAAVRASAVRALGQLRPEAVDTLAARLAEDPAAAVRAELAVALAGAGEAARADELLDGLLTAADPDRSRDRPGARRPEPGARALPSGPRTASRTGRHGFARQPRRRSRPRSTPRAPTSRPRSPSSSRHSMTRPWPSAGPPPRRWPVTTSPPRPWSRCCHRDPNVRRRRRSAASKAPAPR